MPNSRTAVSLVETATKCFGMAERAPSPPAPRPAGEGGQQPVAQRPGVEQGFLGGEGLGGDDEQGGGRVQVFQGVDQMTRVHVGDEMGADVAAVGFQGQADHGRPQVGTADADVHHIGDGLARITLPLAGTHPVREGAHARQHLAHVGHHVMAVHQHRPIRTIAQGRMQYRPAFRQVDLLAGEHGIAQGFDAGFLGQLQQQLQGLGPDQVLGVIQQQIVHSAARNARPASYRGRTDCADAGPSRSCVLP
jgi:hypothetical protein